MKYPVKIIKKGDYWDEYCSQTVIDKTNSKELYCVRNLTDCPEDAIIGRDLVSANEWLDVLKFGMILGKYGYDDVDIEYAEEETS